MVNVSLLMVQCLSASDSESEALTHIDNFQLLKLASCRDRWQAPRNAVVVASMKEHIEEVLRNPVFQDLHIADALSVAEGGSQVLDASFMRMG